MDAGDAQLMVVRSAGGTVFVIAPHLLKEIGNDCAGHLVDLSSKLILVISSAARRSKSAPLSEPVRQRYAR